MAARTICCTSTIEDEPVAQLATGTGETISFKVQTGGSPLSYSRIGTWGEDSHGFNSLEGIHLVRTYHRSGAPVYGRTDGAGQLQPDSRSLRQPHQTANILS